MRKLLKFIGVLIAFVLVVVLALGITLVCCLYDTSDKTPEEIRANAYPVEYLAERELFRSVKDIASTSSVDFSLDSTALNEIVYAVVSGLNVDPVKIEGAYCQIDEEGAVTAEIPVSVFGFKSCLKANLSAGQIEEQLKQIGFETTVDLENLTFTIGKSSLVGFLTDQVETGSESVYTVLLDDIFNDRNISYRCGDDSRIGFSVDVSDFAYDVVRDGEILYPIDYEFARESARNHEAFSEENAPALLNYYVLGYDRLPEEYVSIIDRLELDKNYPGVKNCDELDAGELILEQTAAMDLNQVILNREMDVYITEDHFDQFFSTSEIIGQSYVLSFEDQIVFISCESLMMDIERNQMKLSVVLSVNGKRLIASLTFDSKDNPDSYIEGTLVDVSFGKDVFNPDLYDDLLSSVNDLIDLNWLTIHPSERTVLVDLAAVFAENELIAQLIAMNFNCHSSFTEDGRLLMTYSM